MLLLQLDGVRDTLLLLLVIFMLGMGNDSLAISSGLFIFVLFECEFSRFMLTCSAIEFL